MLHRYMDPCGVSLPKNSPKHFALPSRSAKGSQASNAESQLKSTARPVHMSVCIPYMLTIYPSSPYIPPKVTDKGPSSIPLTNPVSN